MVQAKGRHPAQVRTIRGKSDSSAQFLLKINIIAVNPFGVVRARILGVIVLPVLLVVLPIEFVGDAMVVVPLLPSSAVPRAPSAQIVRLGLLDPVLVVGAPGEGGAFDRDSFERDELDGARILEDDVACVVFDVDFLDFSEIFKDCAQPLNGDPFRKAFYEDAALPHGLDVASDLVSVVDLQDFDLFLSDCVDLVVLKYPSEGLQTTEFDDGEVVGVGGDR